MEKITVAYEGNLRCKTVSATPERQLITDVSKEFSGQGIGYSPTDLLAASLGACMLSMMGFTAKRFGFDIPGARIEINKELTNKPTARFSKIHLSVTLPQSVPTERRPALEKAAMACPVHNSLHPDIQITADFKYSL